MASTFDIRYEISNVKIEEYEYLHECFSLNSGHALIG